MFCTLHLDVQKSTRASRRKRIHDDFAALRHPKSACVIEGVFELLDLVVTVQIKEPVKEIFESLGTVEQLLKTSVVSGINECLSDKFSGNGFLAYNILSFGRNLHKFVPIISLTNKSTNENPEFCKQLIATCCKKKFAEVPCMNYREAA